jgi:hypothetical protein
MPFSQRHSNVLWDDVLRPAIERAGLKGLRADEVFWPVMIVSRIWELTAAANVIIADLTSSNPNVFYELGLAHACKKPVVMVRDSTVDLPFDVGHLQVVSYDRADPFWGEHLASTVTAALQRAIASPNDWVPPSFLQVAPGSEVEPVSAVGKRLRELEAEVAALRANAEQARIGMSPAETRAGRQSDTREEGPFAQGIPLATDLLVAGYSMDAAAGVLRSEGYDDSDANMLVRAARRGLQTDKRTLRR